jgi:hypothetical protein
VVTDVLRRRQKGHMAVEVGVLSSDGRDEWTEVGAPCPPKRLRVVSWLLPPSCTTILTNCSTPEIELRQPSLSLPTKRTLL